MGLTPRPAWCPSMPPLRCGGVRRRRTCPTSPSRRRCRSSCARSSTSWSASASGDPSSCPSATTRYRYAVGNWLLCPNLSARGTASSASRGMRGGGCRSPVILRCLRSRDTEQTGEYLSKKPPREPASVLLSQRPGQAFLACSSSAMGWLPHANPSPWHRPCRPGPG